jgi:uncharacterized membrane protein
MTDSTPAPSISQTRQKAKWGQMCAATALAILILSALVQQLAPGARLASLLLQVLPLAIFVPGMLARHYRTYSWLCFVVLFYFIVGVTNTMSPLADIYSWITLVSSVVLFIAAMMTSRWLQYLSATATQEQ